ncbi:Transmembrane amino acid transporter [Blattamonas nauphoetae]|uniref:Transmembrane amino acid transporter n=1 Tax=Blattamonas nauphoetae TaxID=2049346 RepID=A0ABQ9Y334_9EUKA|nr:Transmembrane amino acid transporter [Blattamonas nauphoetae]
MSKKGGQPSIVLIFSLAATMIGATIISLPWVISQSGLILGPVLVILTGFLSIYTGRLILKNSKGYHDFGQKCRDTLGAWSQYLAQGISVLVLLSAQISLHIFLSQNLHSLVNAFIAFTKHDSPTWWTTKISALIILAVEFPLVLIPDLTVILKISSFGIIAVLAVCVIVVFKGVTPPGGITMKDITYASPNFPVSLGVLSVSFFIHNILPSMFYDARSPKKNTLNMTLGFLLDMLLYLAVGITGYLGYHHFKDPATGQIKTVPDNILLCFASTDIWAFVARICLTLQMIVTWPVMFSQTRTSFFEGFFPRSALECGKGCTRPSRSKGFRGTRSEKRPLLDRNDGEETFSGHGDETKEEFKDKPLELNFWIHILPSSIVFMSIPTMFALFYPSVGNILRFAGSFCGFIYIFLLPNLVEIVVRIQAHRAGYVQLEVSPDASINRDMNSLTGSKPKAAGCRVAFVVFRSSVLILYGLSVFVMQFIFKAK